MSEIPPKDSTSPREIPLKVETRLDLAHGLDLEHVDASGAFLQAQSTHEDRNRDVSVTYDPAAEVRITGTRRRRVSKETEQNSFVAMLADSKSRMEGRSFRMDPDFKDEGDLEDGVLILVDPDGREMKIGVSVTHCDPETIGDLNRAERLQREPSVDEMVGATLAAIRKKQDVDWAAAAKMILLLVAPYPVPSSLCDEICRRIATAAPPSVYVETWIAWYGRGASRLL